MSKVKLDVISFGTAYQYDLMEFWVKPAAEKCGLDLVDYSIYDPGIRTPAILQHGYRGWMEDIRSGKNTWDLRHCVDEAAFMPGWEEAYAELPFGRLDQLPDHMQHKHALPPIQFSYELAWRRDVFKHDIMPDWVDFFDVDKYPGKRSVRLSPHGMIEIALHALGRDVNKVLYDPSLTKEQISVQVEDALEMYDRFGDNIHWWISSYDQHEALVNGEVVMAVAWNRRVIRSSQELDPGVGFEDARLQVNPATVLLIYDWWLIPKGTGKEREAGQLLECMYSDLDVLKSAAKWCELQLCIIPTKYMPIEDDFLRKHMEIGSWKNKDALFDCDSKFWGKNWDWIWNRWAEWRGIA